MSHMKTLNNQGPKIISYSMKYICHLFELFSFYLKNFKAFLLKPYGSSLASQSSWDKQPNALERSLNNAAKALASPALFFHF